MTTHQLAEPIAGVQVRPLTELDLDAVVRIDEAIGGAYRPEVWDRRVSYYLRRDPDASVVAEVDGEVAGFMLGEVRSGEFGLEEPTGWIEVLGVDPAQRGKALGRHMAEAIFRHFRSRGATQVRTLVDTEMAEIERFFRAVGFVTAPIVPLVKAL